MNRKKEEKNIPAPDSPEMITAWDSFKSMRRR